MNSGLRAPKAEIFVMASSESDYLRSVLNHLCLAGCVPKKVLIGSRSEQILSKLNSFWRISRKLGIREAIQRIRRARQRDGGEMEPDLPTVSDLAQRYGFAVSKYPLGNSGAVILELASSPSALLVLAGCGIVDSSVIGSARGGCVNGHPAFLPGLRGVDVVQWALAEDHPIGVTAHYVTAQVDAGEVIDSKPVAILPGESFGAFQQRVVAEQARILAAAVAMHVSGKAEPKENDIAKSTLRFAAPAQIWEQAEKRYYEIRDMISAD